MWPCGDLTFTGPSKDPPGEIATKYPVHEARAWARETFLDYFITTTMPYNDDFSIDEAGLLANTRHLYTRQLAEKILSAFT